MGLGSGNGGTWLGFHRKAVPPGWRSVVTFRFVDRATDPYVTKGGRTERRATGTAPGRSPRRGRPGAVRTAGLPAGGQTFSATRSSVATGAGEVGAGASGATFSSASIVFVKPNQYVATKPAT